MPDSVAIVSGGLDSVTLLHYLVKQLGLRPAVLTFAYGQKHDKEIGCAREQVRLLDLDEHIVADMSGLSTMFQASALVADDVAIPDIQSVTGDPQPVTYVPNRNMIFLALATAYAETLSVSRIFYGAQRHDMYGYWDTTPDFLARINDVIQLNRKSELLIEAPFVDQSKAEILRLGLELGVDYSKTWSCYAGQDSACGLCPTCAERLKAFEEVGILDPLSYE